MTQLLQLAVEPLLSRPHLLPSGAFEAPEVVSAWADAFAIRRSPTGVAESMAGKPKLPADLSERARQQFISLFGRVYGTAILAASQADPELLASYLEGATPTIRNAMAVNPHLPVSFASELYSELCRYATSQVLFRDSWVDYLASDEGLVLVELRRNTFDSTSAAVAADFLNRHSERLLPVWFTEERRLLHVWPATEAVARRAFECGPDFDIAVKTVFHKGFDLDLACQLTREYWAAAPDPSEFRTLFFDRLASEFTERKATSPAAVETTHALVKLLAVDPTISEMEDWPPAILEVLFEISDDPRLAAAAYFAAGGRNMGLESASQWFDVALEICALAAHHPSADFNSRWLNPSRVAPRAARLLAESEELSSSEMLDMLARLYEAALPVNGFRRSRLHPAFFVRLGVDVEGLLDRLSSTALNVLAGDPWWRSVLGSRVRIVEHFDDLDISVDADVIWVDRNDLWSEFLEHKLRQEEVTKASGVTRRPAARFSSKFWSMVHSLLSDKVPSGDTRRAVPDFDARACAQRMVTAAPVALWAEFSNYNLAPAAVVELLPPSQRIPLLSELLDHLDVGIPAAAPLRGLISELHVYEITNTELSLSEKAELANKRGLGVTPISMGGHEAFEELLGELAAHLGDDPDTWGMFISMASSWPADLPSLVWIVSDRSLGSPPPDTE